MKRASSKLTSFLLIICLILSLRILPLESHGLIQTSTSIQLSGTIVNSSLQVGIYTSSYNFAEYTASTIASSFDMSQSYVQTNPEYQDVHSLNSDYKFLLYRNIMSVTYGTDDWTTANNNGWLLKDANGQYVQEASFPNFYAANIASSGYQVWIAASLASALTANPQFDGVYADNGMKYSYVNYNGDFNLVPINPATGSPFTTNEITSAYGNLLNTIIDKIGTNKILMPNGIWNGNVWSSSLGDGYRAIIAAVPRLNTLASEGLFHDYSTSWYSEANWKLSVDLVAWVQTNFLAGHPERYFGGACVCATLPSGATAQQLMLFGFASMLLACNYSSPQNTIDFVLDYSKDATLLAFAQTLHNVSLVGPLGSYYQISSTSVYARDFANAKVLVNPSATSYTVAVSGAFKSLDGQNVSGTVTVAAHTGTILFKQ